ncbi:hypothetical protein B0H19DRAFT_1144459 [Mycena capillaripes]|nr:hypothetical protein B0H19DRAFT_1144459 [Mycena capillaripes]
MLLQQTFQHLLLALLPLCSFISALPILNRQDNPEALDGSSKAALIITSTGFPKLARSSAGGVGSGGAGKRDFDSIGGIGGSGVEEDSVTSIKDRRDDWEQPNNAIEAIRELVKTPAGGPTCRGRCTAPDATDKRNQTPAFDSVLDESPVVSSPVSSPRSSR